MECSKNNILVAMSGGVDSSVAALILKKEGYHVKGVIFRMDDAGMTAEDLANGKLPQSIWYAREAARRMRLEFSIIDVRENFAQSVKDYFLSGCEQAQYPDPCVYCSSHFLFKKLAGEADQLECPKIATGHYAIVDYDTDRQRYVLRKSRFRQHDQSHRLYQLSQEQLSRLVMPLGTCEKEQIRAIAEEARLKNARAPESPEICFIEPDGVLPAADSLQSPSFCRRHIRAGRLCFAGTEALPEEGMKLQARIRNVGNEADGYARILENGILDVELETELNGAAPGQSIVLYDGDMVALGGVILEE